MSRKVLFAIPPAGGHLRDALPAIERLWRAHVGERVRLAPGWGTEAGTEPVEGQVGELKSWIARWEAEARLVLGEADIYLECADCRVILCHDGDLHIETADAALLAEATRELTGMRWRTLEAYKRGG